MLTKGDILKEYANCIMDPVYAIETYFETFDKTQEGFVPFKLFEKQKEIINGYENHRFNMVTKPRQAGVSTTTAAYLGVKVGFGDPDNPEKMLILANKQDMAFEFLSKIKEFLLQIPRWAWGPEYYGSPENEKRTIFITDSKKHLVLPNKCEIKAVATSRDALRGYTPTYLIMDEAAFIDKGAEVFGAALTALGTGGKASLVSTPNGMDPLYYKTYEQSKAGENDFNVIEMKWYQDPRYNKDLRWYKEVKDGTKEWVEETEFSIKSFEDMLEKGYKPTSSWYEEMCRGMNNNARMIAQELDVSFIGSGGNVIAEEDIEFHEKNNVKEPEWVSGLERETWIWEQPKEGHQYIMGVDVSRGDGEDFSTIVILDFTTMEQVMEYRGKIQPDLLAQVVEEYSILYKAYAVVDITGGMGVSTVLTLIGMNFSKKLLHYDEPRSRILNNREDLMSHSKGTKVPGLNVNSIRIPMIANFEQAVREDRVKIRSRRLTSEMKTFIYKNGRPDHMSGYHDDLIMALAMALWVLEHSFKNLEKLEKQTKAMLASWGTSQSVNKEEETGFVPRNQRGKKSTGKPKFDPKTAKNMQDPDGKYLWLFSGTK